MYCLLHLNLVPFWWLINHGSGVQMRFVSNYHWSRQTLLMQATPGVDLKSRNSAQFWILSSFSFTQENVWLLVHFKQRPNVQERLACVASRLCHSHLHVVVYGTSIKSIEVAQPYVYCTLISWSWSWGTISKDSNDKHSWTRTDLLEGSRWHIHIFWVQCTQDKVYITVVKEKITYIWQRGFSSVVCSWL
jgi:hypothetical protein